MIVLQTAGQTAGQTGAHPIRTRAGYAAWHPGCPITAQCPKTREPQNARWQGLPGHDGRRGLD